MSNEKEKLEFEIDSVKLSEIKDICHLFNLNLESFIKNILEKELKWIKEQIKSDSKEFISEYLENLIY